MSLLHLHVVLFRLFSSFSLQLLSRTLLDLGRSVLPPPPLPHRIDDSLGIDWSPGMDVPFDIKLMYFVQCGFYLHSIYGTLYMDYKRKDFYVMLLHHVLTMTLIFVSYATR